MKKFEIGGKDRRAMACLHREVQATIAYLANAKFGITEPPAISIFKTEGGVYVNGREIAIKANYVMDDWKKPIEPTPEEEAVVEAISEVAKIIRKDAGKLRICPSHIPTADPLRAFLDVR